MNKVEKEEYRTFLSNTAKRLNISRRGNIEGNIIGYCRDMVCRKFSDFGETPKDLMTLLNMVSKFVNLHIEEVYDDLDLKNLLKKIPPEKEPVMTQIPRELDDKTDAIMIQRKNGEAWDLPYLAVINCRGWHSNRKYFTIWHEIAHLLLDGDQRQMVFRRTPIYKKDSEEILVDKIAAEFAFYEPIFLPVFKDEFKKEGKLTFGLVERIRKRVCSDASRQATLLACMKNCPDPVYFLSAKKGYKKKELEELKSDQEKLFPEMEKTPKIKLRINQSIPSGGMGKAGIRFHKNMEVPSTSIIFSAFENSAIDSFGSDSLSSWRTSRGPIGYQDIKIETLKINDEEIWAIVRF